MAQEIARDVSSNGGYTRVEDLQNYKALPGVLVRAHYRGTEILTVGGNAWGDTLAEMLNILDRFPVQHGSSTVQEIELLARIMSQALDDRPQEIGSLKPKANGFALSKLSSPEFAKKRADGIAADIKAGRQMRSGEIGEQGDTTHLAVIDAEGNAVSLTTSIGPTFGSRVVSPQLGFFYAHSYRMIADPKPNQRDETEMSPSIVLRDGKPIMVIGAAGSERIPTAILQVISNVIDRGWTLEHAVGAPRIFTYANSLRMQTGLPAQFATTLQQRGFKVDVLPPGDPRHLGIVHGVAFDPVTKLYSGVAEPSFYGSAAGPQ